MNFYGQPLEPINFSKNNTLSILLDIHTFYVCHSTIETYFYLNSKPEEITKRLGYYRALRTPLLLHSMLGMAYWIPTSLKKPVK